jgi:hypothetical protein
MDVTVPKAGQKGQTRTIQGGSVTGDGDLLFLADGLDPAVLNQDDSTLDDWICRRWIDPRSYECQARLVG